MLEKVLKTKDFYISIFCIPTIVSTLLPKSHKNPDSYIAVAIDFGNDKGMVSLNSIAKRTQVYKPKPKVTYKMLQEYIIEKYNFKVHTAYIAEVKRSLGLPMYDAPNAVETLKYPKSHPTTIQIEAIKDALAHFEII